MYGKMQESGLTEIIPSICTSALWGWCPVFSHPEFPQGSLAHVGGLQLLMTDILCLLTWQEIFHSSSAWGLDGPLQNLLRTGLCCTLLSVPSTRPALCTRAGSARAGSAMVVEEMTVCIPVS